MLSIYSYLLFLSTLIYATANAQSPFVQRKGTAFVLNGKPYAYVGVNYWYGGVLALHSDKARGIERLRKELDFLKSKGVSNLRVMAAAEGEGLVNGVERVGPAVQMVKGKFDEGTLKGLDVLLDEMGKRDMKAVLFFSNNWEWSGGFLQYLNWNGLLPDSILRRKLSWDEQRDYVSRFYTCGPCKQDYLKQAGFILNRTNTVNGKRYVDEPTIMAWELANEPRPMRPAANAAYQKWISETAAFIKAKDKNHLVTTGHEGEMGTESLPLFEEVHKDKNIDYLTIHIWPKNWGWFKTGILPADYGGVVENTKAYIKKHEAVAQKLNKPLVIEEFGFPRDDHSFDTASTVVLRSRYYEEIFSHMSSGVIPGVNFWAFNGTARPIKGQTFWKRGDDYMGDPPMEEQGLNGVFDSDAETWYRIYSASHRFDEYTGPPPQEEQLICSPVDCKATKEAVNLATNLKRLLNKGVMFGHQDDLAYGVNWKYVPGNSDIKEVTGDYPAVYGWELGHLELDSAVNLDSVPFKKMKGFIRQAYDRGGVITISWHLRNPLTGKTAWDPAPGTVASILPGGAKHELYKTWLDKVAAFLNDLKGKRGEAIPVIFRPFHELNGNWFWWGKAHCTPDELKRIYRFTVGYLRDEKNLHNLLYAFNTDRFASKEDYYERYPGNDWVDVVGFDIYQRGKGEKANADFVSELAGMLSRLENIATENEKIPALTEFGFGGLPDSTWWTSTLLKALASHKISYALAWRNAGRKKDGDSEYYVPYKGNASAPDFVKFYGHPITLFQKETTAQNLYKTPKPL